MRIRFSFFCRTSSGGLLYLHFVHAPTRFPILSIKLRTASFHDLSTARFLCISNAFLIFDSINHPSIFAFFGVTLSAFFCPFPVSSSLPPTRRIKKLNRPGICEILLIASSFFFFAPFCSYYFISGKCRMNARNRWWEEQLSFIDQGIRLRCLTSHRSESGASSSINIAKITSRKFFVCCWKNLKKIPQKKMGKKLQKIPSMNLQITKIRK